ncbi:MAG: tetratricopeptide repeat protein, partial [Nibricoccus sp.]
EVLLKSGEPEEAVSHYEAALRLAPDAHQTRYVLANTLLQLGELDKAIPQYELLIKAGAPPLAELHNELAIIYAQKGNYAQARRISPNAFA